MARATNAIAETFLKEGELTIDNADTGGFTYLGVAYNSWPNAEFWPEIMNQTIKYLNELGVVIKLDDLKNLGTSKGKNLSITKDQIKIVNAKLSNSNFKERIIKFYKSLFWDEIKGDNILSQTFAESFFDFGVNAGVPTATKIVQKLIGVKDDGDFGPTSLYVLNCELLENQQEIFTEFSVKKIDRYKDIVIGTKTKIKYLNGWLNRTFDTYDRTYAIQSLFDLQKSSTENGKFGPKNIKGFAEYLNGEKHLKNLNVLLNTYGFHQDYKNKKITIEQLLSKIETELSKNNLD